MESYENPNGLFQTLPLRVQLQTMQSFGQDLINMDEMLKQLCNDVERFRCDLNDYYTTIANMEVIDNELVAQLHMGENIIVQDSLNASINSINHQTRYIITQKFPENLKSFNQLSTSVLLRLHCWKRDQQLAANGADSGQLAMQLEDLERDMNLLTCAVASMRSHSHIVHQYLLRDSSVHELRHPDMEPPLKYFDAQLTESWHQLVSNSFIVEKQPPQVIKTGLRFMASVRLLGTHSNLLYQDHNVTLQLITQKQAQQVQEHPLDPVVGQQITNNSSTWRRDAAVVEFARVQIPSIKRQRGDAAAGVDRRSGADSVLEDKMTLLFSGEVWSAHECIKVRAISLPIVVVVHHNQDALAWATVTWDNQFGIEPRQYFTVPEERPWGEVAIALNYKFTSKIKTSHHARSLDANALAVLANKIFRGAAWDSDSMVSWSSLTRLPLPGLKFTFWEWFYALIVALEKTKDLWNMGLIMGFVSKQTAESVLANPGVLPGTFMVRFSDSNLGGIAVVHGAISQTGQQVFEHMLYDSKDLEYKPLADRIVANTELTTIYPNQDKNILKEFCHPKRVDTEEDGYRRPN